MENREFGAKIGETAERAQSQAATLGERAADGLHEAADRLPGGPSVRQFAHRAAESIDATAGYFREHDMRQMWGDVQTYVKAHPTQALIGAVVVGFLAGRAVRRS